MAHDIFVDTSGFYALLVQADDKHAAARRILRNGRTRRRPFVTTVYVLDETATLLKARGLMHLVAPFFETFEKTQACRIEWTDPERFRAAHVFFVKHADQAWSFTDCVSFRVMKQLRLREALTKDAHFHEAGYIVLLK